MHSRRSWSDWASDVEFHLYPGVGHAFFNEDRPEVYHPESAERLWERTVDFFRRTLG